MGMGPKTGRGVGFCAGFAAPGYLNPGGDGYGRGFGRGRGFRRMYCFSGAPGWVQSGYPACGATYAPAGTEKEYLNGQVEILENQLTQVKKRLQEIEEDEE
jgi:hypothetical protein